MPTQDVGWLEGGGGLQLSSCVGEAANCQGCSFEAMRQHYISVGNNLPIKQLTANKLNKLNERPRNSIQLSHFKLQFWQLKI
jgi:hypothetical protein